MTNQQMTSRMQRGSHSPPVLTDDERGICQKNVLFSFCVICHGIAYSYRGHLEVEVRWDPIFGGMQG